MARDPWRHSGGPGMIPAARRGCWRSTEHCVVAVAPTDGRDRPLRSRDSPFNGELHSRYVHRRHGMSCHDFALLWSFLLICPMWIPWAGAVSGIDCVIASGAAALDAGVSGSSGVTQTSRHPYYSSCSVPEAHGRSPWSLAAPRARTSDVTKKCMGYSY